jgi:hypothetical protein
MYIFDEVFADKTDYREYCIRLLVYGLEYYMLTNAFVNAAEADREAITKKAFDFVYGEFNIIEVYDFLNSTEERAKDYVANFFELRKKSWFNEMGYLAGIAQDTLDEVAKSGSLEEYTRHMS